MNKKEIITDMYQDIPLVFFDGFDDAIVGVGNRHGNDMSVIYSYNKCVDILAKDMDYDEAREYLEFNTVCAYVGDHTPIFLYDLEDA
jgi:hypothetical protein